MANVEVGAAPVETEVPGDLDADEIGVSTRRVNAVSVGIDTLEVEARGDVITVGQLERVEG